MKIQVGFWKSYEPPHDKTNKIHARPAKTQISLGICPVWSVFAVSMKKAWVLSYPLSAQRSLWSDWANAQADLSLHWAHSHFVGFVMRRLIWNLACLVLNKAYSSLPSSSLKQLIMWLALWGLLVLVKPGDPGGFRYVSNLPVSGHAKTCLTSYVTNKSPSAQSDQHLCCSLLR